MREVVSHPDKHLPIKILFLNNYDMPHYWQACQEGREPNLHLWGVADLPKYGIDVSILPFERFKFLKQISQKIKILGDLDQQLRVLFSKQDFDVLYSGQSLCTLLIALARRLRLFRKPVVAVIYQTYSKSLWSQLFVSLFINSYDKLICFAEKNRDDLLEFGIPASKLELITQGSDLPFYAAQSSTLDGDENASKADQRIIISAGKTYRDYPTLIEAFRSIDGQLNIYTTFEIDEASYLPDNVQFIPKFPPWREYLRAFKQARAIAIPVDVRDNIRTGNGWCTVLDAMSMSKPIIMTRNPYLPIDLEKEGIGLWVEPGDVAGWRKAVSYLLDNPSVAAEMGERGKLLCERHYNMSFYTEKLATELLKVTASKPRRRYGSPSRKLRIKDV